MLLRRGVLSIGRNSDLKIRLIEIERVFSKGLLSRQPKLKVSRQKHSKARERVDSRLLATHKRQVLRN